MQLLDGVEQRPESSSTLSHQEVICQTTLNGGTADFYIKVKGAPAYTIVTALNDTPVTIRVPRSGQYKVELTGAATVFGSWG